MKHFIMLITIALLIYFGWHYLPSRPKFFVKAFLERHAIKIILIWVLFWGALFLAAHNGSINIL